MIIERVYLAASVTGDVANPQNAVGNAPTTWAGTANSNTSWTHEWSFAAPNGKHLDSLTQTFSVVLRKGSNSGNPTATFEVLRGASS